MVQAYDFLTNIFNFPINYIILWHVQTQYQWYKLITNWSYTNISIIYFLSWIFPLKIHGKLITKVSNATWWLWEAVILINSPLGWQFSIGVFIFFSPCKCITFVSFVNKYSFPLQTNNQTKIISRNCIVRQTFIMRSLRSLNKRVGKFHVYPLF